MLMRQLQMAEHPTPVQMQILDYLEKGPKRRVICAFRGCGKSTLSAMYVLWKLFNNPDEKVLIVSASLSRAEAMSAWLLKTIGDVPWLRHMLPDSHDGRYMPHCSLTLAPVAVTSSRARPSVRQPGSWARSPVRVHR